MITSPRYNLFLVLGCLAIMVAGFLTMTTIDRAWGAPDPIVAADHGDPVLTRADVGLPPELAEVPPAAVAPSPSTLDRILDVAGPVGRGALGGIACLSVAWLLARARDRWGWLRAGAAGNVAATCYAALATFGAVLAVGGGVGVGLTAVGGAMVAGMALGRDPETARAPAPRLGTGDAEVAP